MWITQILASPVIDIETLGRFTPVSYTHLDVYKRQAQLIIPVFLAAGPDLLIPEVDGGILVALFKVSAQHIHIQRLAEAPGAGEQRHHRTLVRCV